MSQYFLRGTAIALSEFTLLYLAAWFVVSIGWSVWAKRARLSVSTGNSNFLFLLQMTPCLFAAGIVLAFAVPAFWRFEPRGEEEISASVTLLGALCVVFFLIAVGRVIQAFWQSRKLVRSWNRCAVATEELAGLTVVKTAADAPPLVIAGLLRPTLYVSSSASELLSEPELARAIAHESVHVRRHDNLKKLLLRLCCFLSARPLERRWLASLEITADQDAVRNRREALDLASALVKASKLVSPAPDLAMTFTGDDSDLLRTRVERLLDWNAGRSTRRPRILVYAASMIALALLLLPPYFSLLLAVHQFSEFLVR